MSTEYDRRSVLRSGAAVAGVMMAGVARGSEPAATEPKGADTAEIQKLVALLDRERQAWIEGRFDPASVGPMSQAPDRVMERSNPAAAKPNIPSAATSGWWWMSAAKCAASSKRQTNPMWR